MTKALKPELKKDELIRRLVSVGDEMRSRDEVCMFSSGNGGHVKLDRMRIIRILRDRIQGIGPKTKVLEREEIEGSLKKMEEKYKEVDNVINFPIKAKVA